MTTTLLPAADTRPPADGPAPAFVGRHYPVAIIGGGQAGLSLGFHLKQRGIDHVILERARIGEAWRSQRWDTFCLVTPNWQCALPGFPYSGDDPKGFMKKDAVVAYIEAYARSFQPPVFEGVTVTGLARNDDGGFQLTTDAGPLTAGQVVVATGGYHTPAIPRLAERFPPAVAQLHSVHYKNPAQLPPGDVLIVGTGQSGCQIAEDLHLAGRRVRLCVGGAPRTARRYRGKDVVEWLDDMGYYRMPVDQHPARERVRAKANHYVTGRDGGRDIDLRKFATEGMVLYGRLKSVEPAKLTFAPDLRQNLDHADDVSESIKDSIDRHIAAQSLDAPAEPRYRPLWTPPEDHPTTLDLASVHLGAVIWSTGFHSDYRWIDLPLFDGKGYPSHRRGVTAVPGVYFLGLPWQYTWGSGRFSGVADDAAHLAAQITARLTATTAGASADTALNEWALGS
jgi:putative flavoprotein involved in K+ transport